MLCITGNDIVEKQQRLDLKVNYRTQIWGSYGGENLNFRLPGLAPCSLMSAYQRFEGKHRLSLQGGSPENRGCKLL